MEIYIWQQVYLKGDIRTFRNVYRTFESNVIPVPGMSYADSAFKDPYEVEIVDVKINYQDKTCTVCLKAEEIPSDNEEHIKKHIEMMKLHGWKCDFY